MIALTSFPDQHHRSTRAEILARDTDVQNVVDELRNAQRRNWDILADCVERCHAASVARASWRPSSEGQRDAIGRYRCKTIACPTCGTGMWRKAIRTTLGRFDGIDVGDLSVVTITGSCQTSMDAVRTSVRKLRRSLRDLRDAQADRRASWPAVEIAGLVNLTPAGDHGAFLVQPVARLLVHHAGVPRSRIEWAMREWVSGSGRGVDVGPYRADAFVGLPPGTGLPMPWRAALGAVLFEWGRGAEPLRIAVGPQGGRQRRGTPSIIQGWQDGPASQKYCAEPMPVLI